MNSRFHTAGKLSRLKPLVFLPPVLIMGLIFFFSSQDALDSTNLSYPVTSELVLGVDRIFSLHLSAAQLFFYTELYHSLVRKIAHASEYFALTATLFVPLTLYRFRRPVLFCTVFGILYAASDELHQLFVPGRSASLKDVCIDGIGVLTAAVFYVFIRFLSGRRQRSLPVAAQLETH